MTWRNDQAKTFKSVEFLADYVFPNQLTLRGLEALPLTTQALTVPVSSCVGRGRSRGSRIPDARASLAKGW